jgi:hypothetical protein
MPDLRLIRSVCYTRGRCALVAVVGLVLVAVPSASHGQRDLAHNGKSSAAEAARARLQEVLALVENGDPAVAAAFAEAWADHSAFQSAFGSAASRADYRWVFDFDGAGDVDRWDKREFSRRFDGHGGS